MLLTEFQKHIKAKYPLVEGKKLLVAISGGIDSIVLTDLLYKLNFDLTLAHCNFQLRGKDADNDEKFVISFGESRNIKVYTKQFETKKYAHKEKLSIQMAARELRYNWFQELIENHKLDYVLTAHHLDDNLETVMINLTRGTGLDGLIGIPEKNGKILRPLLPFSRAEIEKHAKENNLTWREDITNTETKYTRNKIRLEIVPILKQINPNLLSSFSETLKHLSESQQIINDKINETKNNILSIEENGIFKIDINKVKQLSNAKAYLYQILREYGFTEWNDITDLLAAQSGKQIYSTTHRLIKDRDHFLLERKQTNSRANSFTIEKDQNLFETPMFSIYINETKNKLSTFKSDTEILVDGDLLEFPLELRKWQEGDYFYPLGMQGKKKLSKFFKDEKFSILEKEQTWLLCSKNDIVWIVGKRLDNRFKLTENTKKIVQIEYTKA